MHGQVPHDPAEFLSNAAGSADAQQREAEVPIRGGCADYDFEAMIEAELQRQGAA